MTLKKSQSSGPEADTLILGLGYRFSYMSPETDIGGFFETMYQSGLYYHFLA